MGSQSKEWINGNRSNAARSKARRQHPGGPDKVAAGGVAPLAPGLGGHRSETLDDSAATGGIFTWLKRQRRSACWCRLRAWRRALAGTSFWISYRAAAPSYCSEEPPSLRQASGVRRSRLGAKPLGFEATRTWWSRRVGNYGASLTVQAQETGAGSTFISRPASNGTRRRRPSLRKLLSGAALFLLLAASAAAVPGNERDPPMPPTDFGNLFDDGQPRVHDCRIANRMASQATIRFRSNYPYNRARYRTGTTTWSSPIPLSVHQYVCTAPNCLWLGGRVEIYGCVDAAGTNCPSRCTVDVGAGATGRPVVTPLGLPASVVGHVGCVQNGHSDVTFEASWIGTADSGHPRAYDSASNPIALTFLGSRGVAGAFIGRYSIPAGWTPGYEGTWEFTFDIGSGRRADVDVQVAEHCLAAPAVFQVDTSLVRTRVPDGSTVMVSTASQMVVESGNAGVTLTNHGLNPSTETLGALFNPAVPPPGSPAAAAWSEVGDGWDSRSYTSAETSVTLQAAAVACVSDGTHTFWLSPASPSVVLPETTADTNVAVVRTDACAGIVGATPVITPGNLHTGFGTVPVTWNVLSGSEAAGWQVQASATIALGRVQDSASFSGTGWPSSGATLRVSRAAPTSCPPGERVVSGLCETCPDYEACVGGSVQTQQWCNAGSAPPDARMVSYRNCVAGSTQNITECVDGGDPAPTDAPCPTCVVGEHLVETAGVWSCEPISCAAGERLVAGVCEACPEYETCVGGSLQPAEWCNAGNPPADATSVNYQDCVAGVTQTLTACVEPGDPAPNDFVCPAAPTCAPTEVAVWDATVGANGAWVCNPVSCPSGERAVAGVCEPCPTYQICSGNSLSTVQWCNPGNPPGDATLESYQVCSGNSLVSQTACVAAGGSAPGDSFTVSVQFCDSGTTRSRTECVAAGATPPSNAPCSTCPSGQRLVGVNCEACPTYQVCSGNSRVTVNWCNPGNPPSDATLNTYQRCSGGSLVNTTECLDPGETGTPDESRYSYRVCSGNSLVTRYACSPQTSATLNSYQACSGNSLVNRTECVPPGGSSTADATTVSVQFCDSGTTRTRTECVAAGATPPSDAPCTTCPSGQRLVAGSCEPCPTYRVCSGNSRVTVNWCNPGNPPADAILNTYQRCSGGSLVNTTECLDPGETGTPDESRYSYSGCNSAGTALVTRYACSPQQNSTLNTYRRCSGGVLSDTTECLNPGDIASLNEPRYSYRACVGGSQVTRYACTQRADEPLGTETYCSGSSTRTRSICGSDRDVRSATRYYCDGSNSRSTTITGTCADDDDRSGTERYCSGGSTRTRTRAGICGTVDNTGATEYYCDGSTSRSRSIAGCADADNRSATETYCSGGSTRTRTVSGICADEDSRSATRWYCSGSSSYSTTLTGTCTDQDDRSGTEQYCSGNSSRTRTVSGVCGTVDNRSVTEQYCQGTTLRSRTLTGTCTTPPSPTATETYCSGSSSRTRSITGCANVDSRSATRWYCSGSTSLSTTITGTCADDDDRSGTEQYCSGSSSRTRTRSGICGTVDNRSATRWYCSGSSSYSTTLTGTCTDEDDRSGTEQYCSGSSSRTRTRAGICGTVDNRSVTEQYCQGTTLRSRTLTGTCTTPPPPTATETYCSGSSSRTRSITGCANVDNRSATRYYCSGSSERTTTLTGTCTDDDDRSGTEQYCSGSSSRTRPVSGVCGTVDNRSATRYYCVGSSSRTSTLTGTCTDDDDRSGTEQYCSGSSSRTRTRSGICGTEDNRSATETFCDGEDSDSRVIIGTCADDDNRPSSCPSGQSLNSDGCCAPDPEDACEVPTSGCSTGYLGPSPGVFWGNGPCDLRSDGWYCPTASYDLYGNQVGGGEALCHPCN